MSREFAKRAESLERLDILLENAGISTAKFVEVSSNESTITTNVVATFLLALLMLPVLQQTSKKHNVTPTLTIVSSEVHFFTRSVHHRCQNPIPSVSSHLLYIGLALTIHPASPNAKLLPYSQHSTRKKKPEWQIDTTSPNSSKSSLVVK